MAGRGHGKTDGLAGARQRNLVRLGITFVQPDFLLNYLAHPVGYIFPIGGAIGACCDARDATTAARCFRFHDLQPVHRRLLGSVAWGCYPNILIATTEPAYSLTIFNASTSALWPEVGVVWFVIGLVLDHRLSDLCPPLLLGKGPDPLSSRLEADDM